MCGISIIFNSMEQPLLKSFPDKATEFGEIGKGVNF